MSVKFPQERAAGPCHESLCECKNVAAMSSFWTNFSQDWKAHLLCRRIAWNRLVILKPPRCAPSVFLHALPCCRSAGKASQTVKRATNPQKLCTLSVALSQILGSFMTTSRLVARLCISPVSLRRGVRILQKHYPKPCTFLFQASVMSGVARRRPRDMT